MMVWARSRPTARPPIAAMSKSASHISSAPSSGSPSARKNSDEPAAGHVDVQRFRVVAARLELDLARADLVPGALNGRPFAPRAACDALADRREQLPRPVAQRLFTIASALSLPSSVRSARSTGTRTCAWMRVLSRREMSGATR